MGTNLKIINMKIISKYKDYYDYLQGIYGIDNKVVLDRTKGSVLDLFYYKSANEKCYNIMKFAICDKLYDIVINHKTDIYVGKYILKIAKKDRFGRYYIKTDYFGRFSSQVSIEPIATDINQKYKCPIVFCGPYRDYTIYPKLDMFRFASIYPAEQMFTDLYNWITNYNNPDIKDKMTDIEKVESHGFDKKTSFRNIKYK